MKIIKILGPGCAKCKQTHRLVLKFIEENNIEAELIKVEDMKEILKYRIVATPAIVVDEKVVLRGRIPMYDELPDLI